MTQRSSDRWGGYEMSVRIAGWSAAVWVVVVVVAEFDAGAENSVVAGFSNSGIAVSVVAVSRLTCVLLAISSFYHILQY